MKQTENMKAEWQIVPDDSWKPILEEYKERISIIRQLAPFKHKYSKESFSGSAPKCPLETYDDPRTLSILERLRLFGGVTALLAVQVAQTICDLWESGSFILVPLNTRFLLESWARVHYANDIIIKLVNTSDIEKADERTERLTFGSRVESTLPWGEAVEVKSIHINDCIRTLGDVYPEYQSDYDYLSESSHPSFLENTYFMLAGPPMANWKNESYKKMMKPKLDKCFLILENSVVGIIQDWSIISDVYKEVSELLSENVGT